MAVTLAGTLVLGLAGCGGSQKSASGEGAISTTTLLHVVEATGFAHLKVLSLQQASVTSQTTARGEEPATQEPSEDVIATVGYANPLTMPLFAYRTPTSAAAAAIVRGDVPLRSGQLSAKQRALVGMPAGYKLARLSEAQACNVVLISYDSDAAPVLRRRFARAVTQLRRHC